MSSITLEDANTVIAAAIGKARELGFNMAVAVVDLQTSLVAIGADGRHQPLHAGRRAREGCGDGSDEGALPAASRHPDSRSRWLDTVRDLYGGRVTWVQGAVPLYKDGELIGAVGAGGGPPDKDEEVAQAGADALQ